MLCLNVFSSGGTYCAVLLSVSCVLVLDIVIFLGNVTPVLPRWKVARETELSDIPTAAPIRTTADKVTYADDGFIKAFMRVLKGMMAIVPGAY